MQIKKMQEKLQEKNLPEWKKSQLESKLSIKMTPSVEHIRDSGIRRFKKANPNDKKLIKVYKNNAWRAVGARVVD